MRKKITSTVVILTLCASLAVPAYATEKTDNQEWHHNNSISGFTDYAEMQKTLQQIEKSSKGNVVVEVVGKSNRGRDIYKATVGTGKKVILIESEIHGNEKTGTEAVLNLLKSIGSSNSPESKKIRDEVTLVFLPKMNPDASEMDKRRNDMTWEEMLANFPQLSEAAPAWNYMNRGISQMYDYSKNPGFDVNRDFNPDLNYVPQAKDFPGNSSSPGWFITPEAQTVRDVYKSLQEEYGKVDVFVDLHHQGMYYVEGTADEVTLSLSAQFVPDPNTSAGAKYEQYKDDYNYDYSRQLNLAAYNELQSFGDSPFKNITLYSQGLDLPGTALGTFALNGSGTVLFEVAGQTQTMGQKKKGQLVKAVERGLSGIIHAVADGSVESLNPEDYEKIPLTSNRPTN